MARGASPVLVLPTVPSVEAWRAMTPDERMRFQVEVATAMTAAADLAAEGMPHKRAKSRAVDALGLHFKTIGRAIYLAEELAVLYPGDKPFTPDVLAVLDVEQPEDDERMAWVVADEGKGLDFVLEVLHRGDRDKDLVENVERYARLGIAEYFVYDRDRQHVHGFRLPAVGATRYQRIMPQLGHLRSGMLGLDLAVIDGSLRFLAGEAPLPISADLIHRLQGIVNGLEETRQKAEARADIALEVARDAFRMVLDLRGLPCPEDVRARIRECDDSAQLHRWVTRAKTAASLEEVFADPSPSGTPEAPLT